MNKDAFTSSVMRKIALFEKNRSTRQLMIILSGFIFCASLVVAILIFIYQDLLQSQAITTLSLFLEDMEIIAQYWRDTLSDFWIELPQRAVYFVFILIIVMILGVLLTRRLRRLAKKRIVESNIYLLRISKGGTMKKVIIPVMVTCIVVVVCLVFVLVGKSTYAPGTSLNNYKASPTASTTITVPEAVSLTPQETRSTSTIDVTKNEISLTVKTPKDGSVQTNPAIIVTGTTSPSAEVFVNDVETMSDNAGNFRANLTLEEGENPIIIVVTDKDGKSAESEIYVAYEPVTQ